MEYMNFGVTTLITCGKQEKTDMAMWNAVMFRYDKTDLKGKTLYCNAPFHKRS